VRSVLFAGKCRAWSCNQTGTVSPPSVFELWVRRLVGENYGWIDRGLRCITLLKEAA
jgi:hypothetical protein